MTQPHLFADADELPARPTPTVSPLAFEMGGESDELDVPISYWPSATLSRQIELHDDAPPGPGAWAVTP